MSVTPMQLIRMDHKARFCFVFVFVLFYFVGHIIFPGCGWSLCKRLLLIDHTPFKMGWRSNRNFLGHLFDLAVYGLNCFCMLFFFFIINLFTLWCLHFPCEATLQNGQVHVCFYISDGFNLFKS